MYLRNQRFGEEIEIQSSCHWPDSVLKTGTSGSFWRQECGTLKEVGTSELSQVTHLHTDNNHLTAWLPPDMQRWAGVVFVIHIERSSEAARLGRREDVIFKTTARWDILENLKQLKTIPLSHTFNFQVVRWKSTKRYWRSKEEMWGKAKEEERRRKGLLLDLLGGRRGEILSPGDRGEELGNRDLIHISSFVSFVERISSFVSSLWLAKYRICGFAPFFYVLEMSIISHRKGSNSRKGSWGSSPRWVSSGSLQKISSSHQIQNCQWKSYPLCWHNQSGDYQGKKSHWYFWHGL